MTNNKILRKIAGALGYKLVEKNFIKNNRIVSENSSFNLKTVLKKIFNEQKIECLVQIGANDGKRFDELNGFIKEFKPKSILVEPIDDYYQDLKKNYQSFDNVYFENSAISVGKHINEIYTVEKKNISKYSDHIQGINSFDKNHLIKHGVKLKHIVKKKIKCISINDLLEKYNINNLDLLFVDAEGYDANIVFDFLKNSDQEPIIIFEHIHAETKILENLISILMNKKFRFFSINENLICLPKKINIFL